MQPQTPRPGSGVLEIPPSHAAQSHSRTRHGMQPDAQSQDPDLELVITCAPAGRLREQPKGLSWLSSGIAEGSERWIDFALAPE